MMKKIQAKKTTVQLLKYGLVGVSNSLLTLVIIFVLNDLLHVNLYLSNGVGYIAGLINSFIWNKNWVFKSHNHRIKREMLLFVIGFGICYALQLLSLWVIVAFTPVKEISMFGIASPQFGEYLATILAMGVYTIGNYIYNRCITFKTPRN